MGVFLRKGAEVTTAKEFALVIIVAALTLTAFAVGFTLYDDYNETQAFYEDMGDKQIVYAEQGTIFKHLQLPDEVGSDFDQIINGYELNRYRFELDSNKEIADGSFILLSQDEPADILASYKNVFGDAFEYTDEFAYDAQGTYQSMNTSIHIASTPESNGDYLISISVRKNG